MDNRRPDLKIGARLTLFLVSYLPLFSIMIFSQLYKYQNFLHFSGFDKQSALIFIKYFGAISILGLFTIFGLVGLYFLFKNIDRRTQASGDTVRVKDIENMNNESISYLFTYLIPFVFQDLSDVINVVSVSVLLLVTFIIYSNSSMILINPTISIRYSLYMIEYETSTCSSSKKGMIISKNKYLEEDDSIKIRRIGHKLFYAVDI
jgi:hypothetical protein